MARQPWGSRNSEAAAFAGAALLISLAACSGQIPPDAQPTMSDIAATPGAVPTATRMPTASARAPAPTELQGKWRTVISDLDQPVLTITDFKYTIERLGMGTGSIEVRGNQIDFFGSNLCTGRATYSWSIDAGTLNLAGVTSDPCPSRADVIRNRPFTRLP